MAPRQDLALTSSFPTLYKHPDLLSVKSPPTSSSSHVCHFQSWSSGLCFSQGLRMWVWTEPGQGTSFLGDLSAASYLFVYMEMEGVTRVAGRPPGSVPRRRAACTCSTTLSSWGTEAIWKRKQGILLGTHLCMLPLVTVAMLMWDLQQRLGQGRGGKKGQHCCLLSVKLCGE